MRTKDYHEIPKVRDQWTHLYAEHCRIDQEDKAIAIHDQYGLTPVPCANLTLLMLGPGTRITHAAITTLADNGCLVVWCGECGVRFYAAGAGTTRNAAKLLHQASLCTHKASRLKVVRRMYEMRFEGGLDPDLTLQQIRGMEGVRVRDAYARAAKETGVPWKGRNYDRGQWKSADPVNRALSAANACLYGVCHAAIVAAGYSTALGFVHTGKQLSFVYDIADLYKADTTIPAAFLAAAAAEQNIEREVRIKCRDAFVQEKLLQRIVADIDEVLDIEAEEDEGEVYDADPSAPGKLWDPDLGDIASGVQYADPPADEELQT